MEENFLNPHGRGCTFGILDLRLSLLRRNARVAQYDKPRGLSHPDILPELLTPKINAELRK